MLEMLAAGNQLIGQCRWLQLSGILSQRKGITSQAVKVNH
jgi:hypothetical protein